MAFIYWLNIGILLALFIAQLLFRRFFVRYGKFMLPISAIVIFALPAYESFLQYQVWSADPFSQSFLPPHTGIGYFIGYIGTRFFAHWILALLAALVLPAVASYFNRRLGERFFEKEELPLFALGIFLSGYPGFLFYIVLLLFAELLLTTYYSLLSKGRAPLYYLWLPLAIFAILIAQWLIPKEFTVLFNI